MQLILVTEGKEDINVIEVPDDSDGILLAQMVQAELSISPEHQQLEHEGEPIGHHTLAALGIVDGSTIMVKQQRAKKQRMSIYTIPHDIRPEELIRLTQEDPNLLSQFLQSDPELGKCLETADVSKVRVKLMSREMGRHKEEYARKEEERAFAADPDNPELQAKMAERIRLANIQENMIAAYENLPESFGRVVMLYVKIEVNGHPITAFVDSGAQSTIMSVACAERCGITRLIDTRYAGEARGVGTAKIIGRVHIAQMKFGSSHFPISITILENNDVDFLFGLDTLRRYRCGIDLAQNVLRIDGSSGVEEVAFLPENEIPTKARGHYEGMEEDIAADKARLGLSGQKKDSA